MASLVFSVAGAALGSAIGGSVGAMAGRVVGALGGAILDRTLFGSSSSTQSSRAVQGPRLKDLDIIASTEGAPIPRVYGRTRQSGQIIWATKLVEEVVVTSSTTTTRNSASGGTGGKGGGGGGGSSTSSVTTTTTSYRYFANFAVGLCEGPVASIGRVWADGKPLALETVNVRFYQGHEDQDADPLIVAKEGADRTPAYRGLAYIVFERLALEPFGNRIPQLSFEIIRPIGELEQAVKAVVLIPGATEFGYDPRILVRDGGQGLSLPENRHTYGEASDFMVSLDDLQAVCPGLQRVSLVVAWFGDDLRAGHCTIRPKVERAEKLVPGAAWSVAGLTRDEALVISTFDGKAAYGGTPSDDSVIRAIRELTRRGIAVTLYPFVMMDIPEGNALPDPWSGEASQPAYPWRGRITCDPATGRTGSPAGTAALSVQVASFMGAAQPGHFGQAGDAVTYGGPDDWGYRRMVLHMAELAKIAGGVEAFIIGSELVSLTHLRGAGDSFPMVSALVTLADDVKTMLPSTKLTYAADWTEYGAKIEADNLYFPLDALWAASSIAAIGIDYYPPLSDWRDGSSHADRALTSTPYDMAYLRGNIFGGEAFDFFYADHDARRAQLRTPISDGLGKPWVFRQKDIRNWWANAHVERRAGVETAATGWVPRQKPVWITEFGVPAVDKGSNQPSVFPDAKSAAAGLPYFSTGLRDDLIQRRALQAVLTHFDAALGGQASDNPVSPLYSGPMVDPSRLYLWAWDARPYPAFPRASEVWADGANWRTGHWLNGRLATASVGEFMERILQDYAVNAVADEAINTTVDGFVIDRPMSARSALGSLCEIFAVEAREEMGVLHLAARPGDAVVALGADDVVADRRQATVSAKRGQESELPIEITLAFTDTNDDYQVATVSSRRLVGQTRRSKSLEAPVVASRSVMTQQADMLLQDIWAMRETLTITLPPSRLAVVPGDVIAFTFQGRQRRFLVDAATGVFAREITCRALPVLSRGLPPPGEDIGRFDLPPTLGKPLVHVLDLPAIAGREGVLTALAATATPWPGSLTVWRGSEAAGFVPVRTLGAAAIVGETLDALLSGPLWRWDSSHTFRVRLASGAMASLPDERVLAGANVIAIQTPDGLWEVVQYRQADLTDHRTYRLAGLLRGSGGSEAAMAPLIPAGATIVVLDDAVEPLVRGSDAIGRTSTYRIGPSRYDHAHPAMAQLEVTPSALALKPLASVHLRARRQAGSLQISWIRRTRIGGDAWEIAEVPLAEDSEAYALAILSPSGETLRRVTTTTPSWTYADAERLADFGGETGSLRFSVSQLSPSIGAGFPAEATLPL